MYSNSDPDIHLDTLSAPDVPRPLQWLLVIDHYGGVIDNANATARHGDIREGVGWVWGGWGPLFILRLPAMASGLGWSVVLWAMMLCACE
eukprot:scaffold12151_cov40-Cyclotella_meneghiniana.AAC.6